MAISESSYPALVSLLVLHKTTDGDYYKRLMDQRDPARNSVQVNAIHLAISRE